MHIHIYEGTFALDIVSIEDLTETTAYDEWNEENQKNKGMIKSCFLFVNNM